MCGSRRSRSSWKSSYSQSSAGPSTVARRGADLVGAEDQPAPLLAQVPGAVRLPQHPHLGQARRVTRLYFRVRLGDDVLVLNRNDRDVEACHGARAPGEAARRADHVLADDVALVGVHAPLAAHRAGDRGDRSVAVDLRAPVARTGRERLGQVRRLDVSVPRMADRSDEAVDRAQRPDLLDLVRGQEFDVDPDGAGHSRVLAVLVHPIAVHCEPDVADEAQPHVLPGLLLQRAIQLHRVLVDLPDGVAHVEQGKQPRRMPGRSAGQLPALHQHHVRPSLLREVVERADSDDTAADDDDAGLGLHVRFLRQLGASAPSLIQRDESNERHVGNDERFRMRVNSQHSRLSCASPDMTHAGIRRSRKHQTPRKSVPILGPYCATVGRQRRKETGEWRANDGFGVDPVAGAERRDGPRVPRPGRPSCPMSRAGCRSTT